MWFGQPIPPSSYVDPDALDYWASDEGWVEDLEPPHRAAYRPNEMQDGELEEAA